MKEGDNLKGFNIVIDNEIEGKAKESCEFKAKNLERILTILSGMELDARLTGVQGVPNRPGLLQRVGKEITIKYGIEGWIDRIDVTDLDIRNLINQNIRS